MVILAHLGDEDARPPALQPREAFDIAADGGDRIIAFIGAAIDAGHRSNLRLMPPERGFHRVRGLAEHAVVSPISRKQP